MPNPINPHAPELKAVRELVESRVTELTGKVISQHTPLEKVPSMRGEIAALRWLLDELKPKETQ